MGERELVEQLQATLGKLELALGAIEDGIAWTDPRGAVQWCNAGTDRMTGRPHINALGASLETLLPLWRDGRPLEEEHPVRLALGGRAPDLRRCELGPGPGAAVVEPVWSTFEASGRRDLVFVFRDVTRLQRREESLRLSEERYRLAVANVRDYAIFVLDLEGRVVMWNEGAQRINGYAAAEIIGRPFSVLMPSQDAAAGKDREEMTAAARTGRHEYEGWRVRKDGSRYWANVVITAIRDGGGRLLGYSKITRDLSERKLMEDSLLAAKIAAEASNRELEAFCYSVAHDLRAPLRAIDGFSGFLVKRLGGGLDAASADLLARVRSETVRMGRLIDDLLALSRVTRVPMKREPVDLSALAREVGARLREAEPGRRVDFSVSDGLRANGHPGLLRHVFENLLGNAWKYTSRRPAARVEVGAADAGGERAFFVRDDGSGFDMAYSKKLFQAFSRLHSPGEFEGTGIGLAVVKRIVERHGGRVWADAAVDRGATFYFVLGRTHE